MAAVQAVRQQVLARQRLLAQAARLLQERRMPVPALVLVLELVLEPVLRQAPERVLRQAPEQELQVLAQAPAAHLVLVRALAQRVLTERSRLAPRRMA